MLMHMPKIGLKVSLGVKCKKYEVFSRFHILYSYNVGETEEFFVHVFISYMSVWQYGTR